MFAHAWAFPATTQVSPRRRNAVSRRPPGGISRPRFGAPLKETMKKVIALIAVLAAFYATLAGLASEATERFAAQAASHHKKIDEASSPK